MKNIYIHIGMPRAGSTYLQRLFFPYLDSVFYWKNSPDLVKIITSISHHNPHLINTLQLKERVEKILNNIDQKAILISYENLFGYMFNNFYENSFIAETLKKVFPSSKIIIILRRQDSVIESIYKNSIEHGYSQPLNKFLNLRNNKFCGSQMYTRAGVNIDVKVLNYQRIVENYIRLFGEDRLLILPFEFLKTDSNEFIKKISEFMNIPTSFPENRGITNKSYSALSLRLAMLLNRFFRRPASNGYGFIPFRPGYDYLLPRKDNNLFYKMLFYVSSRISLRYFLVGMERIYFKEKKLFDKNLRKEILDIHKCTNKRIDEIMNLGLKKYGYY